MITLYTTKAVLLYVILSFSHVLQWIWLDQVIFFFKSFFNMSYLAVWHQVEAQWIYFKNGALLLLL